MALKREDMLRELELLPAWKQRAPASEEEAKPADMYEPAPKLPPPAGTMQESDVDYAVKSPPKDIRKRPKEPRVLMEEIDPPETLPSTKSGDKDEPSALLSPMGPDRQEVIMRMDWQALERAVEHCPACNLCKTRTRTVFGVGDHNADWLLVGEAPGAEEDRKGEPFVGQAGKLLDNMLAAIKLKRGDNVYIVNVLKCRPPDNRDQHGEEVGLCSPYLVRQAELR